MTDDSLTNPFRRSILLRSESPFEGGLPQPHAGMAENHPLRQRMNSAASSNSSVNSSNNPFRASIISTASNGSGNGYASNRNVSGGSHRSATHAQGPGHNTQHNDDLAPPPSYWEAGGRRHSDPGSGHGLHSQDTGGSDVSATDEKQRLEEDRIRREESYRIGYEEGIRRAEQERRERRERERERRRHHASRSQGSTGRDSGERERERESYDKNDTRVESRRVSTRHRSKSESTGQKAKSSSRKGRPGVPGPDLDVIDKLDVTGLFGPGSFHHDGPFDACTPARNKAPGPASSKAPAKAPKNGTSSNHPARARAPPIEAFQPDGPNNSLKVVIDPHLERILKEEEVYGRSRESVLAPPPEAVQQSFDPTDKTAPVHGQATLGLGSSTFLDGTRASQKAIAEAGRERFEGLSRSRSLLRRQNPHGAPPQPSTSHPSHGQYQDRYNTNDRFSSGQATPPAMDDAPSGNGFFKRVKSLRVKR